MDILAGDLDLLAIGEIVVDMISVEEAQDLGDANSFRKYQRCGLHHFMNGHRLGNQAKACCLVMTHLWDRG